MDKYVQTFDGLDSVDSASVHLQELIDSKMSFKKQKSIKIRVVMDQLTHSIVL